MNYLQYFPLLGAILFCIGLASVVTHRNTFRILLGIELMLNASNINLVASAQTDPNMEGQLFSLFIMLIAAAETVVALSIILNAYHFFKSNQLENYNTLGEK